MKTSTLLKTQILAATAGGLLLAAPASSDVKIDFASGNMSGGISQTIVTTPLTGTLTGFTIDFDYDPLTSGGSWASDAALVIDGAQWGGFNVLFGTTFVTYWAFDGSGSAAAGSYGDVIGGLSTVYAGGTATLIFGNGWSGASDVFYGNITVTLIGVDKVPAPGALALLGVAGFVGRRRRRSS